LPNPEPLNKKLKRAPLKIDNFKRIRSEREALVLLYFRQEREQGAKIRQGADEDKPNTADDSLE